MVHRSHRRLSHISRKISVELYPLLSQSISGTQLPPSTGCFEDLPVSWSVLSGWAQLSDTNDTDFELWSVLLCYSVSLGLLATHQPRTRASESFLYQPFRE